MIRVPFGRPANRGSVPDSAQTSPRASVLSSSSSFWVWIWSLTSRYLTLRMNGAVPPIVCHKWLYKYDRISIIFLDALVPIFCSNLRHISEREFFWFVGVCLTNRTAWNHTSHTAVVLSHVNQWPFSWSIFKPGRPYKIGCLLSADILRPALS